MSLLASPAPSASAGKALPPSPPALGDADRRAPSAGGGDAGGEQPRSSRLLTIALVLVLLLAIALAALRGIYRDGPLEPGAPTPQGAKALAEVLQDAGGEVQTRRTAEDAAEALRGGRTVLVTDPSALNAAQLDLLREARSAGAGRLVLVRPDFFVLQELAPGITPAGTIADRALLTADADCGAASLQARRVEAGRVEGVAETATLYRAAGGSAACFGPDGESTGTVALSADGTLVLGSATFLANDAIGESDNAAIGLNALGIADAEQVTWYLPSSADPLATDRPSLLDRLPDWFWPSLLWILLATLALLLALAHRLGPVVIEPLPVQVRARELTLGRAGMLQRADARDSAARSLRAATAVRLAGRLGVRREESLDALIAALAGHTAMPAAALRTLLGPTPIGSDEALVRLAADLDRLEKEID